VWDGWSDAGEVGDQFVRRDGAFGADRWKDKAFGDRGEDATDAGDVFLTEHSEDDSRALIGELFMPGLHQDLRAGRIVRAVDDGALVPALETRGPIDLGQTATNRIR
jgi:hypothetical protein